MTGQQLAMISERQNIFIHQLGKNLNASRNSFILDLTIFGHFWFGLFWPSCHRVSFEILPFSFWMGKPKMDARRLIFVDWLTRIFTGHFVFSFFDHHLQSRNQMKWHGVASSSSIYFCYYFDSSIWRYRSHPPRWQIGSKSHRTVRHRRTFFELKWPISRNLGFIRLFFF